MVVPSRESADRWKAIDQSLQRELGARVCVLHRCCHPACMPNLPLWHVLACRRTRRSTTAA